MNMNEVYIAGTKVTLADKEELLRWVSEILLREDGKTRLVSSGNVHSFNMAHKLPWYQQYLNDSDIVRLDGAGISLAARMYGHTPPARSTWADFGWPLMEQFAEEGTRVFFFGCAPGIAMDASIQCEIRYPKLQVVGTENGFIDWKDPESTDNATLINQINATKSDVLIIGLGMPRQEQWVLEHRDQLDVKIIMTGGAVFNYLAGQEKRAPKWMLNCGLEWAFRLFLEPRRLFSRYVIGNPVFLWRVIGDLIQPRSSGSVGKHN